jgi:hypothetical protein
MALWGRLGGNTDDDPRSHINYVQFVAAVRLWITGSANGGITAAQAVAALGLNAAEQTEANRLRVALLALANDNERRAAADHLHDIGTFAEIFEHDASSPLNTGAKIEQSLVDWFAAKGVTF